MPTCIYCRSTTTGGEGRAHAIPEALRANDYVLPPGAECDSCNGYLAELDSALVCQEQVWLGVQVLQLSGKAGKPRMELGWMRRRDHAHLNEVVIEGRGIKALEVTGDRVVVQTEEAPGWHPDRFRRSVHRLAFGCAALARGVDFILQERFNPVRAYIRAPQKGERWPYGKETIPGKLLASIACEAVPGSSDEVWRLQLFNGVFFVSLCLGNGFSEWLASLPMVEVV